jgi:hypothetical protein
MEQGRLSQEEALVCARGTLNRVTREQRLDALTLYRYALEEASAGPEGAARAAVPAVPPRDVHHDRDASHERTLQSEQLVEADRSA